MKCTKKESMRNTVSYIIDLKFHCVRPMPEQILHPIGIVLGEEVHIYAKGSCNCVTLKNNASEVE